MSLSISAWMFIASNLLTTAIGLEEDCHRFGHKIIAGDISRLIELGNNKQRMEEVTALLDRHANERQSLFKRISNNIHDETKNEIQVYENGSQVLHVQQDVDLDVAHPIDTSTTTHLAGCDNPEPTYDMDAAVFRRAEKYNFWCPKGDAKTNINLTIATYAKSMDWSRMPALHTFQNISLRLVAMTDLQVPNTFGGDHFKIIIRSVDSTEYVDLGMVMKDMMDGNYTTTFQLPHVAKYEVLIRHYSTCFHGMVQKAPNGPYPESKEVDVSLYTLCTIDVTSQQPHSQKDCLQTIHGPLVSIDQGYWMADVKASQMDLNTTYDQKNKAKKFIFKPFCCNLDDNPSLPKHINFYIIGDSTTPKRNMEVGDVYTSRKYKARWSELLDYVLPDFQKHDVLSINAGLHYLDDRDIMPISSTQSSCDRVHLMLCEIATSFQGKMVVMGSVPVQQQLHMKHDHDGVSDQRVRFHDACVLNLLLQHEYHVGELCRGVADVNVSVTDERLVWFAPIRGMLLPREDGNRHGDKIHATGDLYFQRLSSFHNHVLLARAKHP